MKLTYRHTKIACYFGNTTQAISINLAPVLYVIFCDEFGISYEQVGRLALINFVTQIVADIIATKYVDKTGFRPPAIIALVMSMTGLILLSVLPFALPSAYLGLVIAVIIYSCGSGFIEVIISPIVESMPSDAKESAMSLLHSFYCWGQVVVVLLSTLFIKFIGSDMWRLLPVMWAVIPLIDIFLFLKVPLADVVPAEKKTPVKDMLKSRAFIFALLLMICAGSSELTMSQWSSLFAERGLGLSKTMGDILGMCLFAVFMGAGRLFYGLAGHKINLNNALIVSAALCVICYAVSVLVMNPYISLAGCALCGLSVSLMWPGTLSLSAGRFPLGGTTMFGLLAISGDVGGSIGPWMAGVVSNAVQSSGVAAGIASSIGLGIDQLALKAGIMSSIIFPVAMLILLILFRRDRRAAAL